MDDQKTRLMSHRKHQKELSAVGGVISDVAYKSVEKLRKPCCEIGNNRCVVLTLIYARLGIIAQNLQNKDLGADIAQSIGRIPI